MKHLFACATALVMFCGVSVADETVIHRDGPDATVVHHDDATVVHHDGPVVHDGGCASKTVTKSNGEGDTVSKTKSDC